MKTKKIVQIILLFILILCAAACILPILLVLIASFTDETTLTLNGFSFFPEKWSTAAWEYVWTMKDQILVSYRVTIFITLFDTFAGLLICRPIPWPESSFS